MLREQLWFDFCDDLPIEIEQRIDEGILEAERFKERAEQIKEMPRGAARTAAGAELLEQLCALENPQDEDEPSDLPGIKAASVGEPKEKAEADCDKIYGAWLGRCAGCLLGQPVEGWRRARINGLLKETGNLPLQNYISSDIGPVLREKYNVRDDGHAYGAEKTGWINNVSYMPEDDDTNYTLIALKLVEQYGRDFTPDDAAENWLTCRFYTCARRSAWHISTSHNPFSRRNRRCTATRTGSGSAHRSGAICSAIFAPAIWKRRRKWHGAMRPSLT